MSVLVAPTIPDSEQRTLPAFLQNYPVATLVALVMLAGAALWPVNIMASKTIFAIVTIAGGLPLGLKTIQNMIQGRFYVDTVALLAIFGSVLLREWMAGAVIVLMQAGGEALEDYGLRRAKQSLNNLLKRAPSVAHRLQGAEFHDVAVTELAVGDIVLIRPGDILPADGVVIEGRGNVDEAALTGEPVPLSKQPGDLVFSGTINLSGNFQVRTTHAAAQSKYELIVRMVQQAQGERAPINRLANRYTPWFTLLTVCTAGGVLLLGDPVRALAVLVVATPCPLIIATPLAVLSAINRAAAYNIIVKSGASVEQAGEVKTVVFDKTGTLTVGTPHLSEIRLWNTHESQPTSDVEARTREEELSRLLQLAASIEMLSPHVLANAVVQAARDRELPILPATDVQESPGTGVSGSCEGQRIAIGSSAYLESLGVTVPGEARSERARFGAEGKTVACIAVEKRLAGLLIFADQVRPESAATVRRLREMGMTHILMLTGDAEETARAVAAKVGITEVQARMQPEEKLATVRALAAQGPVMMVGDGINDAPALAAAAVGVAMGGYGAGIATDSADVVITVENVERVADIVKTGRHMVNVARAGILFGIGASLLLMVTASLGKLSPAAGAFCQEAIDLVAILNALRAR